jgi:hypothetical protein
MLTIYIFVGTLVFSDTIVESMTIRNLLFKSKLTSKPTNTDLEDIVYSSSIQNSAQIFKILTSESKTAFQTSTQIASYAKSETVLSIGNQPHLILSIKILIYINSVIVFFFILLFLWKIFIVIRAKLRKRRKFKRINRIKIVNNPHTPFFENV